MKPTFWNIKINNPPCIKNVTWSPLKQKQAAILVKLVEASSSSNWLDKRLSNAKNLQGYSCSKKVANEVRVKCETVVSSESFFPLVFFVPDVWDVISGAHYRAIQEYQMLNYEMQQPWASRSEKYLSKYK